MGILKTLVMFLAAFSLCQLEVQASSHCQKSGRQKKHVDKIVGTYTFLASLPGGPTASYGYATLTALDEVPGVRGSAPPLTGVSK